MAASDWVLRGVEVGLGPLDRVRRALYRVGAPWLGPWIRDREVRIGLNGVLVALTSLALALTVPLWLLALGPLVLGVPHLVADLRYLVARPRLHLRPGAWAVGGLLVVCGCTADLRWGLAAAALAPLLSRASWGRRLAASLPSLGLLVAVVVAAQGTSAVIAHLHNGIAVVLWWLLASALHDRAGSVARVAPVLAFAAGSVVILAGAGSVSLGAPGLHLAALAPGVDAPWAERLVVWFAFAQAVHYGLWLRVVPEEARRRPSPRSWGASWTALRRDLGGPLLAAAVLVTGAIALWGALDVFEARLGYLRLALFHGPLELAVLGLVAAEGRQVLRP